MTPTPVSDWKAAPAGSLVMRPVGQRLQPLGTPRGGDGSVAAPPLTTRPSTMWLSGMGTHHARRARELGPVEYSP
jgi:hypothetical protein